MRRINEILNEMRSRCIDQSHSPSLWPYLDEIEESWKNDLKPKRNFERFNTLDDATKYWNTHVECDEHIEEQETIDYSIPMTYIIDGDEFDSFERWLFAEINEGEPYE